MNARTSVALGLLLFTFLFAYPLRHYKMKSRDTCYSFKELILEKLNTSYDSVKHMAAHQLSFIGEYKDAQIVADKESQPFPKLTENQIEYFKTFKPTSAKDYIIERASTERVVIINEAHHVPYHRYFTKTLLRDLYKLGYRYLGAETINHLDSNLNSRGYPTLESGFYTVEPQYGDLIRQAIKMGFTVFPYEITKPTSSREREIQQAKNIKKIIDGDPTSKVIVHVGHSHLREDSVGGSWGRAMAGRLREFTGINPFTINQDMMTERTTEHLNNPYFTLISISKPTIFVNEKGEGFAGPPGFKLFDVRVFHPKFNYTNGRPDWLFTSGKEAVFINKLITVSFPCLVFAYDTSEDNESAVPLDVIQIQTQEDVKALGLYRGRYNVIVKDKKGRIQVIKLKV